CAREVDSSWSRTFDYW
nr:immunoglobulin heavy chain junction region [Macaca mulatta]MOV89268.1 immunoglobulin heavy chain junction region [Macaca mulatta]MOV89528.1 immunoglobulin heavy chain junction region [Macaca mulatta]MOV90280.1 immunoglobulin heavy chain junction region [Macaca mulatta]